LIQIAKQERGGKEREEEGEEKEQKRKRKRRRRSSKGEEDKNKGRRRRGKRTRRRKRGRRKIRKGIRRRRRDTREGGGACLVPAPAIHPALIISSNSMAPATRHQHHIHPLQGLHPLGHSQIPAQNTPGHICADIQWTMF